MTATTTHHDPRQGLSLVINGRTYRWPSKYRLKKTREFFDYEELAEMERHFRKWFAERKPIKIDLGVEKAVEKSVGRSTVLLAFNFLTRANPR